VVREAVRPLLSSNAHERLERAIGREAAAKEQEAVAGHQALQQSRQGKRQIDVSFIAVGIDVLVLFANPLSSVIDVAV
jgi:hypothetical protein